MNKAQIKHMAERFLGWRLPETFNPDGGISFKKTFNDHLPTPMKHEPTGTNLFDYGQATEMVAYMAEGLPSGDEFAWLIEAPGTSYLSAAKITTSYEFRWSRDHLFAIRFRDQQQAELTMMAIRQLAPDLFGFEKTLGNARPVEHGWMDRAA